MAKSHTSITWRSGTACLEIDLDQTFTPEAFETVLARTGERFAVTFGLDSKDDVQPSVTTDGDTNVS